VTGPAENTQDGPDEKRSDGITVSVVLQMSPILQDDGTTFTGDLRLFAEQLTHYFVDNLSRFSDPRSSDLFVVLTAQRGDEAASHEFRSGHYVLPPLSSGVHGRIEQ
jgi:hypothetical protein